jgi:hypothetical protein
MVDVEHMRDDSEELGSRLPHLLGIPSERRRYQSISQSVINAVDFSADHGTPPLMRSGVESLTNPSTSANVSGEMTAE